MYPKSLSYPKSGLVTRKVLKGGQGVVKIGAAGRLASTRRPIAQFRLYPGSGFVHWGVPCGLHKVNGVLAVLLVVVGLAGLRDDLVVRCLQVPAPQPLPVFVNCEAHKLLLLGFRGYCMSEEWKTFLFQYHHDGATWSIEIPARSEE